MTSRQEVAAFGVPESRGGGGQPSIDWQRGRALKSLRGFRVLCILGFLQGSRVSRFLGNVGGGERVLLLKI